MDKKTDYSLVLQAVVSYLVWAKNFFINKKNKYSVWLIPDGHHIYTGTLKATGYMLLKPSESLVLIWESPIDKKMYVYKKNIKNFMWKSWSKNKNLEKILKWFDIVEFVDKKFDRIDSELPFLNIISNYKNLLFIEIWEKIKKSELLDILDKISNHSNILFISDFHKDNDIQKGKKLDKKILNLSFVEKDKNLYLIDIFLNLAKKHKKTPEMLAYLNSWDVSVDKKNTNGFGTILY